MELRQQEIFASGLPMISCKRTASSSFLRCVSEIAMKSASRSSSTVDAHIRCKISDLTVDGDAEDG